MIPQRFSKFLLILSIAGACAQHINAQTPGVECGCETIGSYVAPNSKAIKVEDGPSYQEGSSPGGKYILDATPADFPNVVHLNIRSGSNSILSVTSRATGWGFSPDGERFVMHGMTTGGQHWLTLYNLDPNPSKTGEDAEVVVHTIPTFVTSASIRFSPHGKYLLYAALDNSGALMLNVYDTKTGDPRYSVTGGAPIIGQPSGKSIAGWGFSPGKADRTFVHAYQTSTDTYSLFVKNLKTEETVMRADNQHGIASFSFSLCGDYFLWTTKVGSNSRHCYFYKTSEANTTWDEEFSGDELISVETNNDNHVVKFYNDNNEYTFPNTANSDCNDDVPPAWPAGSKLMFMYATGTTIGLTWDPATDPSGNIRYKLLQGGLKIAEVYEPVFEIADLNPSTTFDFKVEAGDAAGNWTSNGPSLSASTDTDTPPEWSQGSSLNAPVVEGVKIKLKWHGAVDDWGITGYRIFRNGIKINEIDGDSTFYWVTGLQPMDVDTFMVKAGDAAGHWIGFPQELIISTTSDNAPTWGEAQIFLDEATETSLAFHWDTASDDYGVKKYRITRDTAELVVLPGHIKTYLDEDLEEGNTYTYSIEAGDEAGNWNDPLSADLTTVPSHVTLPLVVASGYQGLPDIDDRLVVWNDNRNGNLDIFNYNLKTGTEDELITDAAWQGQPKSSEGRIVWTDNRNGNSDIYMYDMYDPLHKVVPLCEEDGDQVTPVIDGNTVVWSDYRSGNWDIYMLNLLTMEETAVCTNSSSQVAPDVSGNVIVWEDARHGNPDIYGYSISTGEEFEVCKHSDEQRNPTVEVEPQYRILWQDNRNGDWDIYMRVWFVSSYEIMKVNLNYSGNQTNPDIEDEMLVFQDDKNGSWDIYAYNYFNRYYGNIKPVCLESGDQMNPRTSKGRIVWEDRRNDDGDIYIWDRPPGTDLSLTLKENADPIAIGKTLVYELIASNMGPDDEASAKVVCTLPVEAQLIDTMATAGSISKTGLELTWSIGSLPVDSSEVLRISLKTYCLATLSFMTYIEGAGFDPDPSNNHMSEITEVKLVAGETLEKGVAPSIYTEPYGTSYIVYGTEDSLALASKILHGEWNTEYLATVNGYSDGDIVKDENGNLHISYSDYDDKKFPKSKLYHMTDENQGFWGNKIISISDSGYSSLSMGIMDQGPLHLVFQQAPGKAYSSPFKYMNYHSGAWNYPELIYKDGYDHIDLAMDNEGYLHVAFIALNKGIAYQKSKDTIVDSWLPDELIEPHWQGGQLEGMVVNIGVDNTGTPHVIYPGGTDGDNEENIKYARRIGGSWHFEEVDDGDFSSGASAIAVEPSGIVHLCYSHFPSSQLRYATNVAGQWIKQTLERNADKWSGNIDMEADGYGNVHITYLQNGNVKYALRPPIEYFTIEPDTLDFGTVEVNDSKLLYLKIFNEFAERIFIDTVRVLDNQGYDVEFIPFTLYRGQTDSIPILFAPDKPMKSNSFLRICFTSNSKLFMDIPVKGKTPAPELKVAPDPVSFGTLEPYAQESRIATISNNGSVDLIISDITVAFESPYYTIPTDFSLVSENCSILAPGESCQVEVSFYPKKVGTQQSYLNITSNDPNEPYKQILIKGNAQNPSAQIGIYPFKLEIGYVELNETVTDSLKITNTGNLDLNIYNITLTGTNTDQFSYKSSCSTIPPGDSCYITVDFKPTISGDCSATLTIYSNSFFYNPFPVMLTGNSIIKELSASVQALDFGQKLTGKDSISVITFTNMGDQNVTISEISLLGQNLLEFLHTGWSGILNPGESCNDTIWFAPIFPGEKKAIIRVISDDSDEPDMEIPLSGIAIESAMDLQVAIDAIPMAGVAPLDVQLTATPRGGSPPYTYLWDFDDQASSTEQNPMHTFYSANTYEVRITLEDSEGETAEDAVTITVAETLFSLSGSILNDAGTSGINQGIVELITEGSSAPQDQVLLEGSNNFIFTDLVEGNYTVRFLPDLDAFPDALPTYLGDALMLYEATYVNLDGDVTNQDIFVQNKPGAGSGSGNISGNLVEEEGKKKTTVKKIYTFAEGTPVEGVYVYLINNSDQSLAGNAITDQDGYFNFGGLPEASYRFITDYHGIPMDESNPMLTITEQDDSIAIVATVSAMQISTEILVTGIHDFLTPEGIEIYPNPARDILYLKADKTLIKEGINRIFLLGVNGNTVVSKYFYHSGVNEVEIPLDHLGPGTYVLRCEGKYGFYNLRIVIMK